MANIDKNIIITPNTGSSTDAPSIVYTGANTSTSANITTTVTPENGGTLIMSGAMGEIFRIADNDTKKMLVSGNLQINGALFDSTGASGYSGTSGYQLTSTGAGFSYENWRAENTDVFYVAQNGDDGNDGKSLSKPFLTIKAGCAAAAAIVNADPNKRVTVFVKAGSYTEDNPVTVPKRTAVVGDSLRSVSVYPANAASDVFYVNNGCYVYGMTFRGHVSPTAAIAFNPNGSAGNITTSPYVQNCSSITTTGCGIRIDGSYVTGGIRGMVMDAFTQFNQNGLGVHILNTGYAQLVSIFNICNSVGILCESGGQCSVTNSNSSFGDYGLIADGVYPVARDSGTSSTVNIPTNSILLTGMAARPSVNDVVLFTGDPEYYTIEYSTPLVTGQSTVTFIEDIPNLAPGTAFQIFRRSLISTSGHTFEYVGSGTNLYLALPDFGGQPDPAKEIVSSNGGKVFFTSTDQKGDFKVGSGFTIKSATGTIEGRTFNRSLFSIMTPYILAIT
jgi:hypothetical protein